MTIGILPVEARIPRPFGTPELVAGGDMIAAIRERLGLSQQQFADALSVSRPSIDRWEHNRAKPHRRVLPAAIRLLRDDLIEQQVAISRLYPDRHSDASTVLPPIEMDLLIAIGAELREGIAELYAHVLLVGGHAVASDWAWSTLLQCTPRLFDALPPATTLQGHPAYWGFDVGYALEALLSTGSTGKFAPDFFTSDRRTQPKRMALADGRLLTESKFRFIDATIPLHVAAEEFLTEIANGTLAAPGGEDDSMLAELITATGVQPPAPNTGNSDGDLEQSTAPR